MKLRNKRDIKGLMVIQFFILFTFQLFGQTTFEKTISRDEDNRYFKPNLEKEYSFSRF
jgi:hypothetical protein